MDVNITTTFSAVTDIDTSGIHALEDLYKSLQKRDIQVNTHKQIDPMGFFI